MKIDKKELFNLIIPPNSVGISKVLTLLPKLLINLCSQFLS